MTISTDKLIQLRKDRGWSQEKLAAISGISVRTIQRAEKDGTCSLETKLSLATVLEISPAELSQDTEIKFNAKDIKYKIDWAGTFGLFILGLTTAAVVLLTGTDGRWELASISIVWGLTDIITIMIHGARATYRLFDNTSWIVKYPDFVPNLNYYITQAKSVIENCYIVGVCASVVAALTLVLHTSIADESLSRYLVISAKPLIYSILFCEFWFRPYKRKMEKMLQSQNENSQ